MSGEQNKPPPDEWVKMWYQLAHSDIRWAKEQGWRALQWTIVLLVALVVAAKQIESMPRWAFVILILLVGFIALWYQLDLHQFAKRSRDFANKLRENIPLPVPERKADPNHWVYLFIRIIAIVGAVVFAYLSVMPWPPVWAGR